MVMFRVVLVEELGGSCSSGDVDVVMPKRPDSLRDGYRICPWSVFGEFGIIGVRDVHAGWR